MWIQYILKTFIYKYKHATRDNDLYKPWIVLITYCNSRSTYLDVVPDCYTHSCIEVLK